MPLTRNKLQGTGGGWKTHSHHGNEVGNPSGHRVSPLVSLPPSQLVNPIAEDPAASQGKHFPAWVVPSGQGQPR